MLNDCFRLFAWLHADAAGSKGAAEQLKHTIAAVLSHTLPRCIESLVEEDTSGRRQGFTSLGAFLDWLWPLTSVPERRCRRVVQLVHARLARALLMAGGSPGGGVDAMRVDGKYRDVVHFQHLVA